MIHVLLVDDHPLLRDGVRMRLHATPHIRVVAEAGSVREAEALAAQVRPDLVITDVRMPDASGIQLAALFRERFPEMRLLVLSMHHDVEYVRRALDCGVLGYVLKDGPAQQLAVVPRERLGVHDLRRRAGALPAGHPRTRHATEPLPRVG